MMAGRGRILLAAALLPALAACGTAAAGGAGGSAGGGVVGSVVGSAPGALRAPPAPSGVTLKETGSTLLLPLMRTWVARYTRRFPVVTIATAGGGSKEGITDASAGTADIGTSDAYLSSGDLVRNPALLNIPLVVSAQVVAYNVPGIEAGTNLVLDGKVLAAMYEGTITTWDDPMIKALNPHVSLPPTPVVPVHRGDGSGDTFLFSSYLSTQDPGWNSVYGYGTTVAWPSGAANARAFKGNMAVVDKCAAIAGCVAYAGISYLSRATGENLGYAALENAAGHPELPSPAAIGASVASFVSSTPVNETISMVDGPAADGYPIVNYEYAIVAAKQSDPARARAIRDFLGWVITEGNAGSYLRPVNFVPLPAAVITLASQQIRGIG